ncbi:MAG: hypothetical protein DI582_08125 [Azospirillum brasilense]|nr:MAG: hypothetical protein DI582_08125 [Azospirillum brasilense]
MIATALRGDFGEDRHAIKRISRAANIRSLNTVKAWYDGRNLPNFVHLLLLAQHSPLVMRVVVLLLSEYDYLPRYFYAENVERKRKNQPPPIPIYTEQLFGINVQVDVTTAGNFNARQLWALGMLQQGYAVKAEHITRAWRVSDRTGEADMAKLVQAKLIHFIGARKNGRYELRV